MIIRLDMTLLLPWNRINRLYDIPHSYRDAFLLQVFEKGGGTDPPLGEFIPGINNWRDKGIVFQSGVKTDFVNNDVRNLNN
jgi:hypothetical protein